MVGTPVALVQPQAAGHGRPVAQVPTEGVRHRCRGVATAAATTDRPVGRPAGAVGHRVQVPVRAAVPDRGGDEQEQAARGRAQGRAAGGRRGGVHDRERGTVHGRAQGTERGPATGQPHRPVRVRGRRDAGGHGVPVGAARPVRAASGRPTGGQPAAGHRAPGGRGHDGRSDRAEGRVPRVSDHAVSGRGWPRWVYTSYVNINE